MPKQNLVQTWLEAIGLAPEVLQTFEAAGIVDPKDLAELEISHYPALGVKEPGDRKKLFLLIQRVIMAVPEKGDNADQFMKKDEWQHAGEKTGVDGDGGKHNDKYLSDDDDGIDRALEEQYRPLLEPSFSDDISTGSDQSQASSSEEEMPSPPPSKSRTSHYKQKMFFAKKQGKEGSSSESNRKKKMPVGARDDSSSDIILEKAKKTKFKKNLTGLFRHKKKETFNDNTAETITNEEEIERKNYHYQLEEGLSQDSSPEKKVRKSGLPRITVGHGKVEVRAASSPRLKSSLDERGKTVKISVHRNRSSRNNQMLKSDEDEVRKPVSDYKVGHKSDNSQYDSEKELRSQENFYFQHENDDNGLPDIDSSRLRHNTRDGASGVATRRSKRLQEKKLKEQESLNDSSSFDISSTSICVGEIDEDKSGLKIHMTGAISKSARQRINSIASADSFKNKKELRNNTVNEDEEFDAPFEEIDWSPVSPNEHDHVSSLSVGSKDSTRERHSKIPLVNNKILSREGKRLSTIPSDRTIHATPPAVLTKKQLEDTIDPVIDEDSLSCRSGTSSKNSSRSRKRSDKVKTGSRSTPASHNQRNNRKVDDEESKASISSSGTSRSRKSNALDKTNRAKSSPRSTTKSPPPSESAGTTTVPRLEPSGSKSFDGPEAKVRSKPSNLVKRTSSASSSGAIFVHGKPKVKSWKEQVSRLRDENDELYENEHGSGRFHSDPDDEMRIRVVVRKRPMSRKEKAKPDEVDVIHPLQYHSHGRIMVYQPKTKVDLTREVESLPFAFDNVFGEKMTNNDIYDDTMKNLIPGVFEGRWASVFAYGQTGSGKTFTMMGSTLTGIKAGNQHVNHDENLGLYYLAAKDVFELASRDEFSHMSVRVSLFEIYAGKLFDLLNKRTAVRCLENHEGRVCFPGLSEHGVADAEELMNIIEEGSLNRSTGSTSANRDSSRSHAVLQIHLRKTTGRKKNVEHGRLTFIDLAGSERGADTSQASRTTRLEGAEINTSLLALKEVIRALATGDSLTHVPFRGSKLTQVLKEGFVGKNSRTVMVACVAPNITNCEHTLNTLRYADRVKERNSITGQLSATMAAASKIDKKAKRVFSGTTPPPENDDDSRDSNQEEAHTDGFIEDDMEDDDDNWLSDLDDMDESKVPEGDDDLDELNEVLSSPANDAREKIVSNFDDKILSKKEAVAPLVSSHRAIMTEMLGMVKQEMTLVNDTDADRALIDDYLNELENIQEKQLSMISTLRDSLVEYYTERPQTDGGCVNRSLVSDASFDDLRSLGN